MAEDISMPIILTEQLKLIVVSGARRWNLKHKIRGGPTLDVQKFLLGLTDVQKFLLGLTRFKLFPKKYLDYPCLKALTT